MKHSRRAFLRASLALGAPVALGADATAPVTASPPGTPEGQGLTTYQLGPLIWVRWNNRMLIAYRAHRSQKYPYVFPVAGPSTGLSLTAETALPWPHHRSLFFGCDRVSGGNYWQEEFATGQILSSGPALGSVTRDSAAIRDACEWQKPGEPTVMRDERRIRVSIANDRLYFVDWEICWRAVVDVAIPKTNHSLFALRAAADLTPLGGGTLVNADGQAGEKATFGKPSAWCGFHGRRNGLSGNLVEGLAIFDHPKNPWAPCPWFTRDYGFISPTPLFFRDQPWTLAAGQSVTLRYRVVAHAGDPVEAGLAGLYRTWAASN